MLDQNTLDDIIRRIVKVVQPERTVLFGSAARDAMVRNSLSGVRMGGGAAVR